jgi:hypothetical protein
MARRLGRDGWAAFVDWAEISKRTAKQIFFEVLAAQRMESKG